jgi:hypothetical protein
MSLSRARTFCSESVNNSISVSVKRMSSVAIFQGLPGTSNPAFFIPGAWALLMGWAEHGTRRRHQRPGHRGDLREDHNRATRVRAFTGRSGLVFVAEVEIARADLRKLR